MKNKILSAILAITLTIMGVFFVSCNKTENSSPDYTQSSGSTETEMKLSAENKELILCAEYKLFVISPEYQEMEIAWTTSNTNVVSVSDGVLVATGIGNAVITATAENGKVATCAITVTTGGQMAILDFENNYGSEIQVNMQESLNLKGYVLFNGKMYEDAEIAYAVSTATVGKVENGVFVPVGVGETTVTVTANWRGVQSELLSKTFTVKVI